MTSKGALSSDDLYRLIIRQIADDGLYEIAQSLSRIKALAIEGSIAQSELFNIVNKARLSQSSNDTTQSQVQSSEYITGISNNENIEYINKKSILNFPAYDTKYVATHKQGVTCSAFSSDGQYSATGSNDCSVRIMSVEKILFNASQKEDADRNNTNVPHHLQHVSTSYGSSGERNKPVYKVYVDHTQPITALEFHPYEPLLFSSGEDNIINIYDISKQQYKHSNMQIITDRAVRSINIHPSGEYMNVITQPNIHLYTYDLHNLQCYINKTVNVNQIHNKQINCTKYASDGKYYVTCSDDGSIKIWDGHNNTVIRSIDNAHDGNEVTYIDISPSNKYILSTGYDNVVRLYDIYSGRLILTYNGCRTSNFTHSSSIFIDNGNFVVSGDTVDHSIHVWDSHTSVQVKRLTGHTKQINNFSVSKNDDLWISASDDGRARYWILLD